MPAQDIIKVVLHWSGFGEEGTFGVYYQSAGEHSDTLLANAAGNIETQLGTPSGTPTTWDNLRAFLYDNQKIDKITVYQYNDLPGKVSNQGSKAVNHIGSGTSNGAALQQSAAVKLITGQSGASKRGRIYLPAVTQPVQHDTGRWSATSADALANAAASFIQGVGAALAGTLNASNPLTPVVYSPTHGYVTPITQVQCDNRPDIQRRRAAQLQPTYTKSVTLT